MGRAISCGWKARLSKVRTRSRRRKMIVSFTNLNFATISASLFLYLSTLFSISSEYSLYSDLTMVRNTRYEKIWFPHFWNFWVCYFSAKAELISSFFMSSALRQSLAAWNRLQRGCFQIFLCRICIPLLQILPYLGSKTNPGATTEKRNVIWWQTFDIYH